MMGRLSFLGCISMLQRLLGVVGLWINFDSAPPEPRGQEGRCRLDKPRQQAIGQQHGTKVKNKEPTFDMVSKCESSEGERWLA